MNIIITGTTSGLGKQLALDLNNLRHNVIKLDRSHLDLSNVGQVVEFALPKCDMLINCAGTGIGGKIDFCNHQSSELVDILNVNLVAPVLLTQKALSVNRGTKIVNVTSTNNKRYWPNDLAYSLSKKAFESFGNMLQVEYPDVCYLEVRLGLTKTNFNQNRYNTCQNRFVDIYETNKHLSVDDVSKQIINVLFEPNVKFIEIAP